MLRDDEGVDMEASKMTRNCFTRPFLLSRAVRLLSLIQAIEGVEGYNGRDESNIRRARIMMNWCRSCYS